MKSPISLILLLITSTSIAAVNVETLKKALNAPDSDLLAVVKINTHAKQLYSSTVYTSDDCKIFKKKMTVKDPDVLVGEDGLYMVLPKGEIQPGLCALKQTVCISERNCQHYRLTFTSRNGEYLSATPKFTELRF